MDRSTRIKLLAGAGVAIVASLAITHFVDAHRDTQLERTHGQIDRDSSTRVLEEKKSDTAIAGVQAAAKVVARSDSGWLKAKAAAKRVPQILASPAHDTVKVRELVYVVDTLVERGDSLERAAIADTVAAAKLRAQLLSERTSWQRERDDLGKALTLSEKQHRHWGLGCSAGPGVNYTVGGVVQASLSSATCGLTYRW